MKKDWLKKLVCFWWCNQDCVSIATELCEEFNRRVLLNIYFRIPPHLFPWKRRISWHIAILFLHAKVFTDRGVRFLIARSGLCADCCRFLWEFNTIVLLNIYFRIPPPPPLPVKTADFNTPTFCFFIKKKVMRVVTKSFTLRLREFFLTKRPFS